MNMNTKNILVSFLAIVSVLFLVATISAAEITGTIDVTINSIDVETDNIAVIAGETITVKVYFTSDVNASDVRVKAEIEGDKIDVDDRTVSFDIEDGKRYSKTLTLKVPFELRDEVSEDLSLNIQIWNGDHKIEREDITLRVQRPTYKADIKSISMSNSVEAGETMPVDIVLKNIGYNDLDDLYVTAVIPALGISQTSYFGDLVSIEDSDDDDDTISGRLYLKVPYDAEAGIYTLEIEVENDDLVHSEIRQVIIKNDLSESVIVTNDVATVGVGENAEFNLLIVNPTNKLKVYRVITESSGSLSSSASQTVVAVTAGSSKTVTVTANANSAGVYTFNVNVLSGDELVSSVALKANVEGKTSVTNSIVVLTIVLIVVFLVLLVVLIVLISKKPEKAEDFGESYY